MDEETKKEEQTTDSENQEKKGTGSENEDDQNGKKKSKIHLYLAGWFIFLAVVSIYFIITYWPPIITIGELNKNIITLKDKITEITKAANMIDNDSALINTRSILKNIPKETFCVVDALNNDKANLYYFFIALFSGLLGGTLHALSSLMDFQGQKRLYESWYLWYFALPLTGGMLSLIVFFILRAGLFPNAAIADVTSPFGVAAFGALAGLFTDKATNKISELVDTLFKSPSIMRSDPLRDDNKVAANNQSGEKDNKNEPKDNPVVK